MQTLSDPQPDPTVNSSAGADGVSAEDAMRAAFYRTFALLLGGPPGEKELALLAQLDCDDTPLGSALAEISKRSSLASPEQVDEEYQQLFVGVGRGELIPHASYYLTGFLNEKPLVRLRSDLRALGIEKDPEFSEPEDHVSTLLEIMAGLILGDYDKTVSLEGQQEFFNTHIGPWASHFFKDLEAAKTSDFYIPVGTAGQLFLEVEERAFSMA